MTLSIFIYFILFLLILFGADALHDVMVLNEKNAALNDNPELARKYSKQWHALDAAIKGFITLVVIYLIVGISWLVLVLFFTSLCVRWLWFDACWNRFMGLSFWYRGSVAQSDTLKIGNTLFFTLKFVLVIVSITVTIYLITNQII